MQPKAMAIQTIGTGTERGKYNNRNRDLRLDPRLCVTVAHSKGDSLKQGDRMVRSAYSVEKMDSLGHEEMMQGRPTCTKRYSHAQKKAGNR